jgi:hypothetical protein
MFACHYHIAEVALLQRSNHPVDLLDGFPQLQKCVREDRSVLLFLFRHFIAGTLTSLYFPLARGDITPISKSPGSVFAVTLSILVFTFLSAL